MIHVLYWLHEIFFYFASQLYINIMGAEMH